MKLNQHYILSFFWLQVACSSRHLAVKKNTDENSRDAINCAFGFVGGKSRVQGVHPPEELNKGVRTVR